MANFKIKTPHAAVLIWNYEDRVGVPEGGYGSTGVKKLNAVEKHVQPHIISTLSCVSIQTSKSKGDHVGRFNLVLAPFKNWIGTLTPGSWCVILMSNEPILEKDLSKADRKKVKMLGRIETVRCETSVDQSGARRTMYYVSGVDWSHVFNALVYIDNYVNDAQDQQNQLNSFVVALRKVLFGNDGTPKSYAVRYNLQSILNIMGASIPGYTKIGQEIGRYSSLYSLDIPVEVMSYFNMQSKDSSRKSDSGASIYKLVNLKTGSLSSYDTYHDTEESSGYLDPFSLQGTRTLYQVLLENSNPALNEMFTEMRWTGDHKVELTLYNRIKPFSYKGFKSSTKSVKQLKSYFQFLRYHDIDPVTVISINVGTNWRDKFNLIEIKPQFQEFKVLENLYPQKAQVFDPVSFKREGLRPLIFDIKQFPAGYNGQGFLFEAFRSWCLMMREWYFGTHRMLNGTIIMTGMSDYIAVGDNIRFPADLINPTPNMNKLSKVKNKHPLVLAHVENVSHSFTVEQDGSRTYITRIDFVRGILVDESNELFGSGMLDQFTSSPGGLSDSEDRNTKNVVSTSTPDDPDPDKIKGT